MGLDVIKPVFGATDKARFKPVSSAIETSLKIEISHVASLDILCRSACPSAHTAQRLCYLKMVKPQRQVFLGRGPYIFLYDLKSQELLWLN